METETANKLIVRYLLGDLPEDEEVRLEDRAFADRAVRRSIKAAEADLIDDYVRGLLTETERQQFERRFLVSAERQKKVEFARALARISPPVAVSPSVLPLRPWDALRTFLRGLSPSWQVSLAAAALLLVLGVSWLLLQTIRLRQQVTELQARQPAPTPSATPVDELQSQLAAEQKRNEELRQQLQRAQQQPTPAPPETPTVRPALASLFLAPGLARGNDNRPRLALPPQTQTVRLQIGLERGDDFKRYQVRISTLQGQTIVTRNQLRPQGRSLSLQMPASLLRAGKYEVTLKGVTDAQLTEDVRFYYFDVRKN